MFSSPLWYRVLSLIEMKVGKPYSIPKQMKFTFLIWFPFRACNLASKVFIWLSCPSEIKIAVIFWSCGKVSKCFSNASKAIVMLVPPPPCYPISVSKVPVSATWTELSKVIKCRFSFGIASFQNSASYFHHPPIDPEESIIPTMCNDFV